MINASIDSFVDINDFFRNILNSYKQYFDYIILDTAPAMEGNILNKLAVNAVDEIICPVDGLEAALGVNAFIQWVRAETFKNETMPNISLAMVKYHKDTVSIGNASDIKYNNTVFKAMKDTFGDIVCNHGVKEQKSIKHTVQGFRKTDYQDLSNELMDRFDNNLRENIFDVIDNTTLETFSSKLNNIQKKALPKKPTFIEPLYK